MRQPLPSLPLYPWFAFGQQRPPTLRAFPFFTAFVLRPTYTLRVFLSRPVSISPMHMARR